MAVQPRLLVCDDAPGFRVLVQTVFEDAGFHVAGTAGTWDEAATLAADLNPDAVLLDLWLPTFEPAGITRVRTAAPGALLAVISSLSPAEAADLVAGIAGIDLILSKRTRPDDLVNGVRARLL